MCWALPGAYTTSIQRKLRGYGGELTPGDRLTAASVLECYHALVAEKSKKERDHVIARLREAMQLRGIEPEHED